jgi:hypothetical protein
VCLSDLRDVFKDCSMKDEGVTQTFDTAPLKRPESTQVTHESNLAQPDLYLEIG